MYGLWAEFRHTLRRLRGQIIGWGIGLALYGLFMGGIYDTVNNIEGLEELIATYPPEVMAFFGDLAAIATPQGYFGVYFALYVPLIVGIFAVSAAAGLLAGDEERGTLDLTMAYPISRTALFWGRWLGFAAATALVLIIGYLGWAVTLPMTEMPVTAWALFRPFISMWGILVLFGGLSLLLSMLLPSARLASSTAGGLLVANFLLVGLANLNPDLQPILEVTPYYFFQGGDAIEGLNVAQAVSLPAVGVLLAAAAWLLFLRRDIRVGGERSWSLRRPKSA